MARLTKREIEVMQRICDGFSGGEVAEALGLSRRTVEIHRGNAIRKLDANNQTHAAILFDRMQRPTQIVSEASPMAESGSPLPAKPFPHSPGALVVPWQDPSQMR